MGRANGVQLIQLLGVKSQTKRGLNTRAEGLSVTKGNDTRVVDLGLDKGRRIEVSLGTNLQRNTAVGRLGVVDGLGTRLDVTADAVVVGRGEGLEVVETVHGNSILRGIVPDGGSVASDVSTGDVVRGLGANEETIATQNGVRSESGALKTRNKPC